MLDNILFSLNVVAPVILCCVVGFIFNKFTQVSEDFIKVATNLIFYIGIPASLFAGIYDNELSESFNPRMIAFVLIYTAAVAGTMVWYTRRKGYSPQTAAAMRVLAINGNLALLGIPLLSRLLKGNDLNQSLVVIAVCLVINNCLGVAFYELAAEKDGISPRRLLRIVVTNPMFISAALGFLFALFHLPLPGFVEDTVNMFGKMSTPLALFVLGAQISPKSVKEAFAVLSRAVAIRLLAVPFAAYLITWLLGFNGAEMVGVFIIFGTPSAVNCFVLAKKMKGDEVLAGDGVVYTTIFSAFTIPIGIFVLKTMGFL